MTREFSFERATKNTLRFAEVVENDENANDPSAVAVGTIYVQKWVFEGRQPSRIRVTVEEVTP